MSWNSQTPTDVVYDDYFVRNHGGRVVVSKEVSTPQLAEHERNEICLIPCVIQWWPRRHRMLGYMAPIGTAMM